MSSGKPIIGSIVERKPTPSNAKPTAPSFPPGSPATGFPAVQHRSKSAFARNREETQRRGVNAVRSQAPPVVITSATPPRAPVAPPSSFSATAQPTSDPVDLHEQISQENEAVVASMSPEEIEQERQEILARFGAGISGVLEKARQNRMKRASETKYTGASKRQNGGPSPLPVPQEDGAKQPHDTLAEVPISLEERKSPERARSPPPPALSRPSSRSSSRADNRKLRFAELDPKDVFVYEPSPTTPRRPLLALPPPPDHPDVSVISLGHFQGRMAPEPQPIAVPDESKPEVQPTAAAPTTAKPSEVATEREEEGTPEYIRRRYFPDIPADDPNIEWMKTNPSEAHADSSIRFDLHGAPIPLNLSSTLPTHLGLHHHAEGSHAGYTLDDIFLLTRSTVPAQRAAMFGVLSGISKRVSQQAHGRVVEGMEELAGQEEALRKRIAAAGVEAMNERGSVGVQAIDVVWQTVYEWDKDLVHLGLGGILLESSKDETIRSLPLDFILPSAATIFNLHGEAYPQETLRQILEIIQRLALQNVDAAEKIVATDGLLAGVVRSFLLPSQVDGDYPKPSAIKLLTSLVRSSRQNAEKISKLTADTFLRFIVTLPPSSPFPTPIAHKLITATLDFYSGLATYGLCTHIASTAMEQFNSLSQYIQSTGFSTPSLVSSWLRLAQAWTVCAVDPHATSPPHDILWSRVSAWGWHTDALQLLTVLDGVSEDSWRMWGDLFGALSAWVEGSKINGLRGGEVEREEVLRSIRTNISGPDGKLHRLVHGVADSLLSKLASLTPSDLSTTTMQNLTSATHFLTNVVRLWLACLPPHLEGPPPSPPFDLPFGQLSTLAVTLLSHPIWALKFKGQPRSSRYYSIYLRDFSAFLGAYLRLSRRFPDTSPDLWLAQALSISLRYQPGDEDQATATLNQIVELFPETTGKPLMLAPFLEDVVFPREKDEEPEEGSEDTPPVFQPKPRLAPLVPSPKSIGYASTAVLTSPFSSIAIKRKVSGLPLSSNWMLSPMHHLLHSGDSPVFKYLPNGWDFSELDVTRVVFSLALKSRQILSEWKLSSFTVTEGEAVLACMEVFMLEHGLVQDKSKTTEDEVFRDKVVEGLMTKLLEPYRFGSRSKPQTGIQAGSDLEALATAFLGPTTPFYQFYTDFIGLYDAISFSHPLFGLLLLPPISMRFAVDYRRLFWTDYSHILKTISVYSNQVISTNLGEYMYPLETDAQVLGGFLSVILKGTGKEFLRWVPLHHIACNIWSDLRDDKEDGPFVQERAMKLFQAVVTQGDTDTVANVIKYKQPARGATLVHPPDCFGVDAETLDRRKVWIQKAFGEQYSKRLAGLI